MKLTDINPTEIPDFYTTYTSKVETGELIDLLEKSIIKATNFIKTIPENKTHFAYAPEKWTVIDVIQHLIDAERIFAYRALRIARFDTTPLPSFEENDYANVAQTNRRNLTEILNEYTTVRQTSLQLFRSFTPEMLANSGGILNKNITPRAIGFIILGHEKHHFQILNERYLNT